MIVLKKTLESIYYRYHCREVTKGDVLIPISKLHTEQEPAKVSQHYQVVLEIC